MSLGRSSALRDSLPVMARKSATAAAEDPLVGRIRPGLAGNPNPGQEKVGRGARPVAGYIIVGNDGTRRDMDLKAWLDLALAHVSTLPPKKGGPAKKRG